MNALRRPPEPAFLAAAALAAAFAFAPPALAEDKAPSTTLKQVERSLGAAREREETLRRKANAAENSLRTVRERAVRIAADAQEHEGTLVRLGERLAALKQRQQQAEAALGKRRGRLGAVLAALQRLSMHPPVALIALPASPADTVRSALLLRDVVPAIETQARNLRDQVETLGELTAAVAAAQTRIEAENTKLRAERQTLAELVAERTRLARKARGKADQAAREAERLGREAKDLRDLIARLARERANRPPARTAPTQENVIVVPPKGLPVRGRVMYAFGTRSPSGGSEGVSIRTLPRAQVVAPRSGRVVFAGPFRGLGRLLIIQYGDEYHLLLAGLARIDTAVGDSVLAGEPVGVMGASGDPQPLLYMELRRKGRPINPLPWLAARQTKVNG